MSGPLHIPPSTPATELPCPPASLPLEMLLRHAGTGDHGAFAELYDATAARAFGIALSVTRTGALAEDVVREAYSEIWRTAVNFDPERGSGAAWMLAIVHGKAVARVRATDTRLDDGEETPYAGAAHGLASPEGQKVRFALSHVPPAQRKAVELAYFGSHTHTAIARLTGVPAETVKSRIREGLTGLRRGMQAAS